MIKITVELCPMGDESRARHLGTARISNQGTGNGITGDYKFWFSKREQPDTVWKKGEIKGFPRKRLLMWDLLFRCLRESIGERNERN